MNELYNDEEKLLREQAIRFVEERIKPRVEEWEREGAFPREVFGEFAAQGYLGVCAPEEFGGAAARPPAILALAEAMEHSTSAGVGAAILMHAGIVTRVIGELATDEYRKKLLPGAVAGEKIGAMALTEPGAGSDLAGVRTRARRDGDEWVINGSKTFITNGVWCDFALVLAREEGTRGYRGMNLFIVEKGTPGFSVSRRIETVGWCPSQTGELVFEDVRIPATAIIGQEGRGFQQVMKFLEWERLMMANQSVVKAELALEMTAEYCLQRVQFGRPIAAFQVTRHKLAEFATRIEVDRALVTEAARRFLAGKGAEAFVASAKLLCCSDAQWILDECLQLHGGYGYTMEYPIQRLWRDHRLFTIGGGTNEVQKEIIAKTLDR